MENALEENSWKLLLKRIAIGKCTPFLGAGASFGVAPLGSDIARAWAKEHKYPLEDCTDLARVAQFLAVQEDAMYPKEQILEEWFKDIEPPDFTDPDEPHRLLAELPLPVYMTTNYDDFMVQALRSRDKEPKQVLCRWNKLVQDEPSGSDSDFKANVANPVVFHLHGHRGVPDSLVLTEDDYLDFLVNISRDQKHILPPRIQAALAGTSLLFIGYSLSDWNFRVLFRGLVASTEKTLRRTSITVQLLPQSSDAQESTQKQVQQYLDAYFGQENMKVYWGTARDFAKALRQRWKEFKNGG
jgi:hypothetical protein